MYKPKTLCKNIAFYRFDTNGLSLEAIVPMLEKSLGVLRNRARERLLTGDEIREALRRALTNGWASASGGHVAHNWGKYSEADGLVAACWQGVLYVAIGRGPTRASGVDAERLDISMHAVLNAPDWVKDEELRIIQHIGWIRRELAGETVLIRHNPGKGFAG